MDGERGKEEKKSDDKHKTDSLILSAKNLWEIKNLQTPKLINYQKRQKQVVVVFPL